MSSARFLVGDVFDRMAELPDNSVDLIVTSPPFLALRSYLPADHPSKHLEIGSEPTPAAFLSTLLALTREWRRILTPTGSLCVELGDTYAGSKAQDADDGVTIDYYRPNAYGSATITRTRSAHDKRGTGWPLDKSLCLIPSLFAGSLAYGHNLLADLQNTRPNDYILPWRVRNLIVWHRPNPPVGALGDKVRPSTSYVTVACTAKDRWFDLDSERTTDGPGGNPTRRSSQNRGAPGYHTDDDRELRVLDNPAGAPPLDAWFEDDAPDADVWTIPTAPYAGSHYATFPPALPRRLINLMCPRQVCTSCGEPRRRIVGEQPHRTAQDELAAHIEQQRKTAGYERRDLAHLFPHYKNTESILAQFSNWERGKNVPAPVDWEILRPLLHLSDAFAPYVYGDRQWTESTIEYVGGHGQTVERSTWASGIANGQGAHSNKTVTSTRVAPDEWSDCEHDKWRRGIVCDPFAGSGTTLQAASELGRDSIGIDLDRRNLSLARQRLGMFLVEEDEVPA